MTDIFGDARVQRQWGTVVLKGRPEGLLGNSGHQPAPWASVPSVLILTPLVSCAQIPEASDHRLLDGARSLHFPRIQESHSGLYACQAANQAGRAQRDFNLAVFGE